MTLKATEAKTYLVDKECDNCQKAYYQSTGNLTRDPETGFMTNPVRFEHKCPACGDVKNLLNKFPTVYHVRHDAKLDLSDIEV